MKNKDDIKKCLLCYDAPCNKSCSFKPSEILKSAYFNDLYGASNLAKKVDCTSCDKLCEKACINNVKISNIINNIKDLKLEDLDTKNIDISSSICGIKLKNPFLLSSSVVSSSYEMVARAFDLGWAGAVYKTVSLINIKEASPRFTALKTDNNYICGFKNIEQLSEKTLEENLEIFRKLKKNYPDNVLIVSIMGRNEQEWEDITRKVAEAGVDAIELNFSCPNMEEKETGIDIGQSLDLCYRYTAAARRGTNIPILAKLTPNITDISDYAHKCIDAGADGIAAINTIKSITDFDINDYSELKLEKTMISGYSGSAIRPIALRFIEDLAHDKYLEKTSISGIGGIESWKDALQYIILGCDSVQVTTAIMQYGYDIVTHLINGLKSFMAKNNYKSIRDIKGLAIDYVVDSDKMDRKTIVYPKHDLNKCVGCGRCYVSCLDGGHQAISFDPNTRKVSFDLKKCYGCFLCFLVCPSGAISRSNRVDNPRYAKNREMRNND